jgi:release factor glutamine methyltransferase
MSNSPSPRSQAAIVARLRAAGCVFAEDEARLLISAARTPDDLAAMVGQRAGGLPLEHVLGWAEFCGLRIAVDPGVFRPRPRTEFLVSQAVALARGTDRARLRAPARSRTVVVDLCCGSGALGVALVAALDEVELHAADIDPRAVQCARRNVLAAGGQVYEGDLYESLPTALRGSVDVLLANAPYVPTDAIALLPPEARLHESLVALDGGTDGLDILRRVIAGAPAWLAPGGHLLVESSFAQAPQLVEFVELVELVPRVASSDEFDGPVVIASRQ